MTIASGTNGPAEGSRQPRRAILRAKESDWVRLRGRGTLAAAGRHSVFVRFLRRAIPLGCAAAVAVIGLLALFDPFKGFVRETSFGQIGIEGTKLTLSAPKISGFQKDQRPYAIKGRLGLQDLAAPNIVELLDIDADIGTPDSQTIRVMASRAVYNSVDDDLFLEGDVKITNPGGYDASMDTANIDFKSGSLESDAPVLVRLDGGAIAADKMTITDNGHRVSFVGKVKSVFDEGAETARESVLTDRRK